MFQTHWDKCLINFKEQPSEETLEPLYTKEVKKSVAFAMCMQSYDIALVTGIGGVKIERSYPRLLDLVRKFLDIQQVNENDDLANNPKGKNSNGYSMMTWEDNVIKLRNGDCKNLFYKGVCHKVNCEWTHDPK